MGMRVDARVVKAGWRAWADLTRPFTLLPPAIGMISGALSAAGAGRAALSGASAVVSVAIGSVMAATLNAASNVLNQVHDLELDRINKPERPIPSGAVPARAALAFAWVLYAVAIALAFLVRPAGAPEVGWIVAFTAVLTWAYSAPPLRARNSWWLGPLVIAVPRGLLLKVAGWGTLAPVLSDREPWILGGVFFCYVLGAAPTKDFADMEGDRAGGSTSLPIRFGPVLAGRLIAPFLCLPGILLALLPRIEAAGRPLLAMGPRASLVAGIAIGLHGLWIARLLVRSGPSLTTRGERRSWRHMYLLMMELQIAAALLYAFR
jgi:4-hydroxybenzoate polyprenyltransferase